MTKLSNEQVAEIKCMLKWVICARSCVCVCVCVRDCFVWGRTYYCTIYKWTNHILLPNHSPQDRVPLFVLNIFFHNWVCHICVHVYVCGRVWVCVYVKGRDRQTDRQPDRQTELVVVMYKYLGANSTNVLYSFFINTPPSNCLLKSIFPCLHNDHFWYFTQLSESE